MTVDATRSPSCLLAYLPAICHTDPFLGQFLLAFEKILLGRQDDVEFDDPGLEETIADLALILDPKQTPEEFLPWLASWTAFSLRADLDVTKQRDFIANIIPLYRWRGTKRNLQELLTIFTVGEPTVTELEAAEFQIGVHSRIGEDTYLGGGPPHFFRATISLHRAAPEVLLRQMEIARALIELEKPAHTHYELVVTFPSMQIGVSSTVGVNTLIGTLPEPQD
jgi:phage tail-like protein